MTDKWRLLEPIRVGTMSLRNRIVMPPMEARLNRPDGSVMKVMIDYYSERARGGVGAIRHSLSACWGYADRINAC